MAVLRKEKGMDMAANDKTVKYAKLEWYREVLSLEPNSKLFLAHARLLAELGSEENNAELINEAFAVLRRGLDIHPDYMEARLFLIELLNMCGCRAQCGAEVARLASLFLSYPDFWDAWREYAVTEKESSDFTVALGFMSAIMRNKSLSIVQVLEAGLNALKTSSSPLFSEETLKIAKDAEQSGLGALSAEGVSRIEKCMRSVTAESGEKAPETDADQAVSAPEAAGHSAEEENESFFDNEDIRTPLQEETAETEPSAEMAAAFGAERGDSEEPVSESSRPEQPDADLADVFPKSHLENYANFAEQQKYLQEKTKSTKETLAELIKDANITVEPMENSPFRTRSMADLLAEQGDYRGALDIYKELLQKGHGNREELEERIADIKMLAPELAVEIDKSKLLAIDDMVDTSFGLMAKNASPSDGADSESSDFTESAAPAEHAEDGPHSEAKPEIGGGADVFDGENGLGGEITAENPASKEAEHSEEPAVRENEIPDLFGTGGKNGSDAGQGALSLDMDTDEPVFSADNAGQLSAAETDGKTSGGDLTADADLLIDTDTRSVQEKHQNGENYTEPVSAKSHNDVADLLTKLAERLEIRAK